MTFIIFTRPAGTSKTCINSSVTGLWYIVFKFAGASPRIAADHSGPWPVRVKFKAKGFEKVSVFMNICMQAKLRVCSCWVSGKPWCMMWTNSGVYVQMNASEAPRLQLLRGKLWRMMWNISLFMYKWMPQAKLQGCSCWEANRDAWLGITIDSYHSPGSSGISSPSSSPFTIFV